MYRDQSCWTRDQAIRATMSMRAHNFSCWSVVCCVLNVVWEIAKDFSRLIL